MKNRMGKFRDVTQWDERSLLEYKKKANLYVFSLAIESIDICLI
jgi:hypothetical protein